MAPEQARGEVQRLDERCDVFGLGAILCVILTGKPPYVGTKAEVFRQAARGALEEVFHRLSSCGADAELVTLAKAGLPPDPEERPRHAGEVAEYVAGYQAKVQERLRQAEVERTAALVKAAEERKRRRLTLGLAALVAVVLVGSGAAGFWYQQQQAERERRLGEAEKGIELTLNEATKLLDRGLTHVADPSAWETTLAAARAALQQAQTLLAREPPSSSCAGSRCPQGAARPGRASRRPGRPGPGCPCT
jgi:serine/threonine-protein kinase